MTTQQKNSKTISGGTQNLFLEYRIKKIKYLVTLSL
jgi:hypothetical protein